MHQYQLMLQIYGTAREDPYPDSVTAVWQLLLCRIYIIHLQDIQNPHFTWYIPDSKVHGTNMVLLAPDGPHVGPMNFAISDVATTLNAWCIAVVIFHQFQSDQSCLFSCCHTERNIMWNWTMIYKYYTVLDLIPQMCNTLYINCNTTKYSKTRLIICYILTS